MKNDILKKLFNTILNEVENNPEFKSKIETILQIENIQASTVKKKKVRELPQLDPIKSIGNGKNLLISDLAKLSIEELKDIISFYKMDTTRLAMKWKDKQRLINHIVLFSERMYEKGDVFRKEMVYTISFGKDDVASKRDILISFDLLDRKKQSSRRILPLISLHSNCEFKSIRDNDVVFYFLSDETTESKEFINKWNLLRINSLPENTFHILGTYEMTVKALELGSF